MGKPQHLFERKSLKARDAAKRPAIRTPPYSTKTPNPKKARAPIRKGRTARYSGRQLKTGRKGMGQFISWDVGSSRLGGG